MSTPARSVRVVSVGCQGMLSPDLHRSLSTQGFDVYAEAFAEDFESRIANHAPALLLLGREAGHLPSLLRRLGRRWPVLLLSADSTSGTVLKALRAGAAGYLLQASLEHELVLALRSVVAGYRYLSPQVCSPLLELTVGTRDGVENVLTTRQSEVLRLLAQGHCVKEIAYRLALSVKTVNAHKLRLKERLGINDLVGLVFYSLRQGLIDPPVAQTPAACRPAGGSFEYAQ